MRWNVQGFFFRFMCRKGENMPRTRDTAIQADVPPLSANRLLGTRILPPTDAVDRSRVTVNLAEQPLAWLARRAFWPCRPCAIAPCIGFMSLAPHDPFLA
jgi:hypothetical protein